MPTNMSIWRKRVTDAVHSLSDEVLQRRSWFGIGPEESSPTEDICQLIDDTDFERHLEKNDMGLNQKQIAAGRNLIAVIHQHQERHKLSPSQMIDDPRWLKIREAAKQLLVLL